MISITWGVRFLYPGAGAQIERSIELLGSGNTLLERVVLFSPQ